MAAKGPWPYLSGFDRPRSTTGDAPLPSAFFERAVKILATAVSAVFFVRHWRLDHPPFLLGDREQLSTVAVGRLIGDVAVIASLSARPRSRSRVIGPADHGPGNVANVVDLIH